ncbi:MAG: 3-deoxy-8-phosphooctulonate synthase [Deltaproteobacteria bacterium]|nr:MAG: 3-deoxy-8-phosphooctulonate synthase [Deltaproteobacteria bacterium]
MTADKVFKVGQFSIGRNGPFFLIAGPCVVESKEITMEVACFLRKTSSELDIPVIFKSSYDKANRTSLHSYRGPGMEQGLEILATVRKDLGLPVLSDVHLPSQIPTAEKVLDVLQIPAFLCRQTDLILAAARTGLPVNIKKGQFLSPMEMGQAVEKVISAGNRKILLTERGTTFGYNNLVVDMRSIQIMGELGFPVVFDATHSVQLPGQGGSHSGGQRQFAAGLAKAAVAAGADGVFMEIHPDPDSALCDGPNSLPLDSVKPLIKKLKAIHQVVRS